MPAKPLVCHFSVTRCTTKIGIAAELVSERAVGADTDAAGTGFFEHRRNRGRRFTG